MNKIQYINVATVPFAIDEDAFQTLNHYLQSLESHFSHSEGCKEIMDDIEARLAELFQEKLKGRSIVSKEIVQECIQIMGSPETFGAEWSETDKKTRQKTNGESRIRINKRLFRDMEDCKVAGVCSGLAHYLGIDDPLWVRLAFVGAMFLGFGFIVYVVLWIAVPEARTSADRLAMQGDPINFQNIADKVEEEIERLTDQFENWRDKWRTRKKKW
jgi:phage shock protein PspC (stress-responsive transcriptional regulator)